MKNIDHTVHDSKEFQMRSDRGCEACHGPGKAHVESGGEVELIRGFKKLEARASVDVCLTWNVYVYYLGTIPKKIKLQPL